MAETTVKDKAETVKAKPEASAGPVAVRPLEQFMAAVLPPQRRDDLIGVLPKHVPFERFERNLANAIMQNPDLLSCPPGLVFREVSKLAALGLLLDPQLGEAYLVIGWNGKEKRKEPQSRIGYRGFIKLARQSGDSRVIYAHEVCENDECMVLLGTEKSLIHKPAPFGKPRGPVVGYYAVCKLANGETDFETMDVEQVNAIRDRSDAWKAFKDNKIRSTPWSTDQDEMGKKTVLRRLCKRVPMSPDLADALRVEDHAEGFDPVPPAGGPGPAKTASGALDGFAGKPAAKVTDADIEEGGGQPQQGGDPGPQGGSGEPAGTTHAGGAPATSGAENGAGHAHPGGVADKQGATADDGAAQEAQNGPQGEGGEAGATVAGEPAEATSGAGNGAGAAAKMPPDIEAAWTQGGEAMPGYKWLVATIPTAEPAHRLALATEHKMILQAISAKSPGYKDRIKRLLTDNGVNLVL